MDVAGKKGIMGTVKTFCNQKALNEQSQTENMCWRSIQLYSVCLFRIDLGVGSSPHIPQWGLASYFGGALLEFSPPPRFPHGE